MLSPQASLIRIDAELKAMERRLDFALASAAPKVIVDRLFAENIHLRREYGRAVALIAREQLQHPSAV